MEINKKTDNSKLQWHNTVHSGTAVAQNSNVRGEATVPHNTIHSASSSSTKPER